MIQLYYAAKFAEMSNIFDIFIFQHPVENYVEIMLKTIIVLNTN